MKIASIINAAVGDQTVGTAVNTALDGLLEQAWLVITGGLLVWALIYGLGIAKKAGKKAVS